MSSSLCSRVSISSVTMTTGMESTSHFGKDISDNLSTVIFSHIGELGPGQGVVEVVFHLVVLGQAEEVTVLHVEEILGLLVRDSEHEECCTLFQYMTDSYGCVPDVHGGPLLRECALFGITRSKCALEL